MTKPAAKPTTLTCPEDVHGLLTDSAAKLSAEFGFEVTPQQAFERFARLFLGQKTTGKGTTDGAAADPHHAN